MRALISHAIALLAGAAITVPAYAAADIHHPHPPPSGPAYVATCADPDGPNVACQVNLNVPRGDVRRFRFRFLINHQWEYIDMYWPHGKVCPAGVACRPSLGQRTH